jgi:hypothetical protein
MRTSPALSIEIFNGPYKTLGAATRAMRRMADQVREVYFPGISGGSRRFVTTVRMTNGMMSVVERNGGWSVRAKIARVHLDVRITEPGGHVRTLPLDIYEAEKARAAGAARESDAP